MNAELWPEARGGVRLVKSGRAPGYRTRILVVDRDPSAVAMVRSVLRSQDWEVITAKTGTEGLEKARQEGPDAIVTELDLSDMSGPDLCRALRLRNETATTPIIVLSTATGVSERVASLRAGAFDYLVKPPDAQELVARLKAALDLRKEKSGFVIAVLGTKGGVGASLLAVNVATALRQETRSGVVLVDAALRTGVVDILLNVHAGPSGGRLPPRIEELDEGDFEAIMMSHATGIQVLLPQQQGYDSLTAEELRKMLMSLRRLRDFVVVDTPPLYDETAATILDLADRVLLVLTPEIPALRGARLFVEQAVRMGLSRERVMPILNRFPQKGGLPRRAIENALGLTIQGAIADDVKLVTYSVNRGVPVVESHPRSSVAKQVAELAKSLASVARQQQ